MLFIALFACVSNDMVRPLYDQDGDGFYVAEATAIGEAGPFDCDDADRDAFPGAEERCDGKDDDCDGDIDEDAVDRGTWYLDADGDGYGDPDASTSACEPPDRYITDGSDCDDLEAAVHPDLGSDACNGRDDDCDGTTDEDPPTWHYDGDGDGYGSDVDTITTCTAPTGYIEVGGDCDDGNKRVSPDATEYCNGRDDDCDGLLDTADPDNQGDATWYADADDDGFGSSSATETSCSQPSGYVDNPDDCDDTTSLAFPGGDETCEDGIDGDCDGVDMTCGLGTGRTVTDASATFTVGTGSVDGMGAAVTAADVDGDGYDEVVVSTLIGPSGSGEVYAWQGGTTLLLGSQAASSADVTAYGSSHSYRVSVAGDFDGDGHDDVALGALDDKGPGSARVLYGSSAGLVPTITSAPGFLGEQDGDYAGWTLAAGDLDGDGYDDLAVGAWFAGSFGKVYLEHGSASPWSGDAGLVDAPGELVGVAGETGMALSAGDVDGDGLDDLAIGSADCFGCQLPAYVELGAPSLLEGSTTLSYADVVLGSDLVQKGFGTATAVGDLDSDGYADVLVVAVDDTGTSSAFLYDGMASLPSSETSTDAGARFTGLESEGDFRVVVLATDLDGDGADDVVLSSPATDVGGHANAGAVYVWEGGAYAGSYATSTATVVVSGDTAGMMTGVSLASGDVNEDGAVDLLVGGTHSYTGPGAAWLFYGAP